MPGLMARLNLIFKSKFSKALDRAENPNETLDYSYEEQIRQLQNVKRGIADVTTAKKRLELQYTSMQQQVDKLDGQARDALKANREDLAREALTRKAAVQGQLDGIMQQGQQLEAQQQKLIEGERTLQAKVEAFRTQKETIKAQYSAAEAQVRISEAATGVGEQMADVGLALQRAVDKTENMKARADAVQELDETINLALSTRGIHALEQLGIADEVLKHAISMPGRMIHPAGAGGELHFSPYDRDPRKHINSIGRAALNTTVIEAALRYPNVSVHFNHRCTDVDLTEAVEYCVDAKVR